MELRSCFICILVILFSIGLLWGQSPPLTWGNNWDISAKAMGLGGAYTAAGDNYSLIYYNPAGLGQIKTTEISGTFSYLSLTNEASFVGRTSSQNSGYNKLNSFGFVFPVSTIQGSLVFGFSYHQIRQFDHIRYASSNVSMENFSANWEVNELEEGGLSNTSIAGSIEMAPGLFLGAAINIWGGEDDYTRKFGEYNVIYNNELYSDSTSTDHSLTQFSGLNFTISTFYSCYNDHIRFGGTIITPVTLKMKEDWDYSDMLIWDDGTSQEVGADYGYVEYKIQSPWIFRAGCSFHSGPILIAGDVEINNYSQIRYKTDPPEYNLSMSEANLNIRNKYRITRNYHLGAELSIPRVKMKLRAGYAVIKSPYKNAQSKEDRKVISFGAGFEFMDQFMLDAGFALTSWESYLSDNLYNINRERINTNKILFTLTYRI
jgi:long-subunit fatty acid transport protein